MTKIKYDNVMSKRDEVLDIIFEASKEKHEKRSRELSGQSHKAELILISWGFIFAGIAGFYQANVLNSKNTQQVVFLIIPIVISVGICVMQVMHSQKESDVPNLSALWKLYTDGHKDDYAEFDAIAAKEQVIQAYVEAEEKNRIKLGKKAYWLTKASWAVVIEMMLIIAFVILPNLMINIQL